MEEIKANFIYKKGRIKIEFGGLTWILSYEVDPKY